MFKMPTYFVPLRYDHHTKDAASQTACLKTNKDSQSEHCDLALEINHESDEVVNHETAENLSQSTTSCNDDSSNPVLLDATQLFAKTDDVKRGVDNKAFSNNDDSDAEEVVTNRPRKNSIFPQDTSLSKAVSKTSLNASEMQHNLNKDDGLLKETESLSEDISDVADERGKGGGGKGDSGENETVSSKEADDIVATEICKEIEEEDSDGEVEDMFYALSRSSIDLRINVRKTYKVSKIRKTFIILSCFFMQVCLGMLFSLGILYVDLLDAFEADRSVTSLVQSLPLGLAYILGLIVGPLIQKFGLRLSIFCGGLLSATGFIASSFANDIYTIIILVGCVTGTGISLFNIGTYAAIPVYFGKKQKVAVAFASFGTGTGAMVWPLINRALLEHFGWRGNMLVSGGILLNICCIALLFRPLPLQVKEEEESEDKKKKKRPMRDMFLQLVKMPMFLALMLWSVFDGFSTPIVGQMIVDFSRHNGYGKDRGAILLVYYSACNAIGRATVGIISRYNVSSRVLFILSSSLCGVSFVILSLTNIFWMTQVAIIIAGFLLGSHVALNMIVLLRTVGSDLYGLGWGLAATGLGTGFTMSGPIAGYISERTSYHVSFYVSGFTMIADMTFYVTVYLIHRCMKRMSKTNSVDE